MTSDQDVAGVLFDATPLARGHAERGIGAATRGLLDGLREVLPPGRRPHVLVTSEQDPPEGFAPVPVAWRAWRVDRLPDLWPRLTIERRIRRIAPALFHATQHELIPDGRSLPVVAQCHDLIPLHEAPARATLLVRRNLRHRLRTARFVCCHSRATADDVAATLGIPADRLRIVPLAVPPHPSPAGDTPQRPYLLYSNSLEPHKNPALALHALAAARADVDLVITGVGGPALQADVRTLAERLGIAGRLHMLGYVPADRLAALRRDALAALVTSRREGFGLPVLEALESGCPTLVADTPALTEVGADAVIVLPAGDAAPWGAAIDALVADPARRTAMSAAGHRRAAAFSWPVAAERLVGVWREALSGR